MIIFIVIQTPFSFFSFFLLSLLQSQLVFVIVIVRRVLFFDRLRADTAPCTLLSLDTKSTATFPRCFVASKRLSALFSEMPSIGTTMLGWISVVLTMLIHTSPVFLIDGKPSGTYIC